MKGNLLPLMITAATIACPMFLLSDIQHHYFWSALIDGVFTLWFSLYTLLGSYIIFNKEEISDAEVAERHTQRT